MSTFDRNWRELQLETLVDFSLELGGVHTEEDLVEELLQRAVGTLDASFGLVGSLRSDGSEVVVRAVGFPPRLEAVLALLGDELLERLDAGQVVRSASPRDEAPFELLAAPMRWRQKTLGMVILGDKETREGRIPFSESDARFLLSLSSMVATAISTSRRVAEIERDRERLEAENRALRDQAAEEGFVGDSPPVRAMLELVQRVAPTGVNVMLRGESGVGKERVAHLLHRSSDRAAAPFVAISCAALPESLLEAELFGIEEGVATGVQRRIGKIEMANGGTLFLDEVADLSLPLQAKLLRLVQERELERLGGRERIPVDVHLVTATNRDLETMVADAEFRGDLYYRLRVVVINVPTLRERRTDIPLLARHFVQLYGQRFGRSGLSLTHEALAALMAYHFPGNVRELENILQAAVALAHGDDITAEDLRLSRSGTANVEQEPMVSLAEMERRHIERVLQATEGNRQKAASVLGIDRSTLYRKMRHFASCVAVRNTRD